MWPESWTALEAPVVLLLSEVCESLALTEDERATVLGTEGVMALADELVEVRIRPISRPRPLVNKRQAKALAYAREHGAITMHIYRQICPYWFDETLRVDLVDLVKQGRLVKNGDEKGTRYTLPRKARVDDADL